MITVGEYTELCGLRLSFAENGREIGRTFLYTLRNELHSQPFGYLEDVFVEDQHRGRGIGTELVRAAIALAAARGCYKVVATSRFSRVAVHSWYEKEFGLALHGYEFRLDIP